jgi:SAM-dependent methyltransferase
MQQPIQMEATVTEENFDEILYLRSNPDVKVAVEKGTIPSGQHHFRKFGQREKRRMRFDPERLGDARREKLRKIMPHLRADMNLRMLGDKLDYLTEELRSATRIVDTDNVSANGYDNETVALIKRSELVLDCGCGRRQDYYHNVINYEIVDYDTTDVLGVGEKLPFKDDTFDAVISIAVLEHVRDPFICAREISRVLKPGGELFCSVPFLQPYHGYPHHYFNATHQGIQRLFEDDLSVERVYIPEVGHPAFSLFWFLSSWVHGLPQDVGKKFSKMTVGELLKMGPEMLSSSIVGELNAAARNELACSFVLQARK